MLIHLEKNSLIGTLSLFGDKSEVFRFLEHVDLSVNALSGTIHERIAQHVPNLKTLYLVRSFKLQVHSTRPNHYSFKGFESIYRFHPRKTFCKL